MFRRTSNAWLRPRRLMMEQLEDRLLFDAVPDAAALAEASEIQADPAPAQTQSAVDQAPAQVSHELIIIDPRVANPDQLLSELIADQPGRSFEVRYLNPNEDGVEQITRLLESSTSAYDAVHIFTHGQPGQIQLGSTWLSPENLAQHAGEVARWGSHLTADADLLFYGCDVAQTAAGVQMLEEISILSGADVAASDDLTGHTSLGGDWDLEVTTGTIETGIAVSQAGQDAWRQLLAPNATMVGAEAYFRGSYVEAGIRDNGTFGASNASRPSGYNDSRSNTGLLGIIASPTSSVWTIYDGDFVTSGPAEEGFTLQVNGTNYSNNTNGGLEQVAGSITGVSTGTYHGSGAAFVDWSGTAGGLRVDRHFIIRDNSQFILMQTTVTNTAASTANNIYWMHNVDPDNDQALHGSSTTTNRIVNQASSASDPLAVVQAVQTQNNGSIVSMVANDARARVTTGGFANRDASAVWNGTGFTSAEGATVTADQAISLAFNLGSLAPGASVSFSYAYEFSTYLGNVIDNLNAAPLIDLNSAASIVDSNVNRLVTFTEGGSAVNLTSGTAAVSDLSEGDITRLSIVAAGQADGALETLTIAGTAFTLNANSSATITVGGTTFAIAYVAATGGVTILNNAGPVVPMSQADLTTLIRSITYLNTNQIKPLSSTLSFTFTARDTAGRVSAPAVSQISIIGVNDAPDAIDNTRFVSEDAVAAITGSVVTDNSGAGVDSDPENYFLNVINVNGTAVAGATTVAGTYGTLIINPNGTYSYTVNTADPTVIGLQTGQTLTETFAYTITDFENLVTNGSMEGAPPTANRNVHNSVVPPNWDYFQSPDVFNSSTSSSQYIWAPTPDGGDFLHSIGDWKPAFRYEEGFSQTVNGLTVGQQYLVRFSQSISKNNFSGTGDGHWRVRFGSETQNAGTMTTPSFGVAHGWETQELTFTATSVSQTIEFTGVSDTLLNRADLAIDGIQLFNLAAVSLTDTANLTITINGVNDAPILDLNGLSPPSAIVDDRAMFNALLTNNPTSTIIDTNGNFAADPAATPPPSSNVGSPVIVRSGTIAGQSFQYRIYDVNTSNAPTGTITPGSVGGDIASLDNIAVETPSAQGGAVGTGSWGVDTRSGSPATRNAILFDFTSTPGSAGIGHFGLDLQDVESSAAFRNAEYRIYKGGVQIASGVIDFGAGNDGNDESHFWGYVATSPAGFFDQVTIVIGDDGPGNGFTEALAGDRITFGQAYADANSGRDYETSFTENGPGVAIVDTDVAITDVDDTNIETGTIVLTNAQPGDLLWFASSLPIGITSVIDTSVPGIITVTLTGSATKADYQTAIAALRFENTSDNPPTTPRIIAVTVNDGDVDSNTAFSTIYVIPVNDPPVIAATGTPTYTLNQSAVVVAPTVMVTDVDDSNIESATVTVSNTDRAHDSLTLNSVAQATADAAGITVVSYNPATGELVLSGSASLADYQAVLAGVQFSSSSGVSTDRTISFVVNDGTDSSNVANVLVKMASFGFDSFNNLSQTPSLLMSETWSDSEILLSQLLLDLGSNPILCGVARPGTHLVARLYSVDGSILAEERVIADAAGNWMIQLPGRLPSDAPRLVIEHISTSQVALGSSGFRLSDPTYSQLQFGTTYGYESTADGLLGGTAGEALSADHTENLNPLNWL